MSSTEEEKSCNEALRNPLILQEIFKHLKTKFLLSSVSLVNTYWNRETRTYIRDNRVCTAFCPIKATLACRILAKFSQYCYETTQAGRVIPWNRFKIHFSLYGPKCLEESSEEIFRGLVQSELRLRHLAIIWWRYHSDCAVHQPLLNLLRYKSSDIQSLSIRTLCPFLRAAFCTETLQFSRLEEISFVRECTVSEESSDEKAAIARILESAPRLERIICYNAQSLEVVPEKYYHLLHYFEFPLHSTEYAGMYAKILQKLTRLNGINITKSARAYNESVDDNLTQAVDVTLERLLQSWGQGLREMYIWDLYPLGRLHFPPLVNLTKLMLSSTYAKDLGEFWGNLAFMNMSRNMPGLKVVRMHVRWNSRTIWSADTLPHRLLSNSVRELFLGFEGGNLSMLLFKCAFPQISTLDLMNSNAEPVNFSEIWELWPQLEHVQIRGWYNLLKRNYDTDFCGIFPEEVAQLETEDEDYLRAVHIVPVKPSLLTMTNLRKLRINLQLGQTSFDQRGLPHVFLSKVSQLVVLRRRTCRDVSVLWTSGASELEHQCHRRYLF